MKIYDILLTILFIVLFVVALYYGINYASDYEVRSAIFNTQQMAD